MRTTLTLMMFLVGACVLSCASKKETEEFPLVIHITAVDMQQGVNAVSGGGSTDSNGNYSSSVSGGGSYTWKLYTARIEDDNKVYGLSTRRVHYPGGLPVAMATFGWSARRNASLHVGDYRAHWNKDRTLEIQFSDEKNELKHQTFHVESERLAQ